MHRRRLLASLGALLPAAGCLGSPTGDRDRRTSTDATGSRTTTARPTTATRTPTDGTAATPTSAAAAASVGSVEVTPGLVVLTHPDAIGVVDDAVEQFVVATVSAGSPAPDPEAFAADAGGETYSPMESPGSYAGFLWNYDGERYGDAREGWLAFRLPNPLDADSVALTWPGGEHRLDEDAVRRLARPPTTFEVRAFDAPGSVAVGESATLSLEVANVGDADGEFVGAVNRRGPWIAVAPETAVSLTVPAGETATWEHTFRVGDHGDDGREDLSMSFTLRWRGGSRSRTLAVE